MTSPKAAAAGTMTSSSSANNKDEPRTARAIDDEDEEQVVEEEEDGEEEEEDDQDDDDEGRRKEAGLLLTNDRLKFELLGPMPMPPVLNMQYICETASRLLFLSVHWLKSIQALDLRPDSFGEKLLKKRWCETFILGLVQCSQQFCLSDMLTAVLAHLRTCALLGQLKQERYDEVRQEIELLQSFLARCRKGQLDLTTAEYSYLKLISFVAPDSFVGREATTLQKLQQRACSELREHLKNLAAVERQRQTTTPPPAPPDFGDGGAHSPPIVNDDSSASSLVMTSSPPSDNSPSSHHHHHDHPTIMVDAPVLTGQHNSDDDSSNDDRQPLESSKVAAIDDDESVKRDDDVVQDKNDDDLPDRKSPADKMNNEKDVPKLDVDQSCSPHRCSPVDEALPPATFDDDDGKIVGGRLAEADLDGVHERTSQLLLLLPALRSFNKQLLVELFFSGLIGNVQVENVLPFILKMDVLQIFGKNNNSSQQQQQHPKVTKRKTSDLSSSSTNLDSEQPVHKRKLQ